MITQDELRRLFLFEHLDAAQLQRVWELGDELFIDEGSVVCREGDPAECFYVLLAGEISMNRRVSDGELEIVRTNHVGSYFGATAGLAGDKVPQLYATTVRITADARVFVLPSGPFSDLLRSWFPMAVHLLEGMLLGRQNIEAVVGQRERLLALGQLSAGLTHELNNPAAAAVRATATLRERVAAMRHKLAMLANGEIAATRLSEVVVLQDETVERTAKAARLSPMELADREDELSDWLADHGIEGAYDLAAIFAAGGLDPEWADGILAAVDGSADGDGLPSVLRWLAYTIETEQLMREIEDATTRISTLLASVKQYSGMDRAPFEQVDLVAGLDSTLAIFGQKLGHGVTVERHYAPDLPRIPGYGGELNQVWTNLIDNALQSMAGTGTLTLRTSVEERGGEPWALVEIGDTGPGIAPDNLDRIFEPFFTTKPIGEGTGLGLDISYRIVVTRHRGALTVRSEPGDTRFTVALPVRPARATGG